MTEIQSSSSPIRRMAFATVCVATAVLSSWSALATEVPQQRTDLVNQLRALKADVLDASERESSSQMLQRNIRRRLQEANQRSTRQWQGLKTREGWDTFRITQLNALRKSLGTLPADTAAPRTRTSGRLTGDGFEVEKLLFESRPGLWVTANLYRPIETKGQSPGILICHSHHNPKTEEELQIMGMTWAREGCFVLVMDQLGHGERRQHPFRSASDYSEDFRVGRQDYFYRYDTSLQLALIGESLMGWMVNDLVRGIDVLVSCQEVDRERIILIGAVAGGGGPAAVTAALDERVAVAIPFNFGGPQPENRYPLPDDSDQSFPYAGSGSWESTRNLRLSASDGFLPWVIVSSIAPRRLVYAHEFSWDKPRDPVWKRLQTVYGWYQADDRLAFAHGAGVLRGQPPEATHCNNVGRAHRAMIYPALGRWFEMSGAPEEEYSHPFSKDDLNCWTQELRAELKPKLVHNLAAEFARQEQTRVWDKLKQLSLSERRDEVRKRWAAILGNIAPNTRPTVRILQHDDDAVRGAIVERTAIEIEQGIQVPLLLILPNRTAVAPVVVGVCQQGKSQFLSERAETVAQLLSDGISVCLIEVRGTGETALPDTSRDRGSTASALSASEWMLGGTLLGARLRDLRTALEYLRAHKSITRDRIVLWGESFAPTNSHQQQIVVPHGTSKRPSLGEPLGGLLILLAALYEDEIRGVYNRGTLMQYSAALHSSAVHLPHDAIVPGAITAGDIPAVLAVLSPIPVHVQDPIDGTNCPLSSNQLDEIRDYLGRQVGAVTVTYSAQSATHTTTAQWLRAYVTKN